MYAVPWSQSGITFNIVNAAALGDVKRKEPWINFKSLEPWLPLIFGSASCWHSSICFKLLECSLRGCQMEETLDNF
jgi:hypothetical protein